MIKRVNCQPSDQILFCGGGGGRGEEQRPKGKKGMLYNFTKFKSPAAPTVL